MNQPPLQPTMTQPPVLHRCFPSAENSCIPDCGSSDEAACLSVQLALKAQATGTFGVGGLMLANNGGYVIQTMLNDVNRQTKYPAVPGEVCVYDSTAHVERQLCEWYWANKTTLGLPEPKDVTIVTTLDPCVMCAGSILASGFNVGVVALDPTAGVNAYKNNFVSMPACVQPGLRQFFGYYGILANAGVAARSYSGGTNICFMGSSCTANSCSSCSNAIMDTLDAVKTNCQASGLDPKTNPFVDPNTVASLKTYFKQMCPAAFSIPNKQRQPSTTLVTAMKNLVSATPGAKNACALIDYYGNLMHMTVDTFSVSPIHTSLMNLIQQYSKARYALVNNYGPYAGYAARHSYTTPMYGTIVYLNAPDINDVTTFKDLGLYGSANEGTTQAGSLQYVNGDATALTNAIAGLPPLYNTSQPWSTNIRFTKAVLFCDRCAEIESQDATRTWGNAGESVRDLYLLGSRRHHFASGQP